MPPAAYADRFVRFMANMTSENDNDVPVGAALSPNVVSPPSQMRSEEEVKEDHLTMHVAVESKQRLYTSGDSSSTDVYGNIQQSNRATHESFLNPSSLSSSHAFTVHPSSDPTYSAGVQYAGATSGGRTSIQAMGITDSAQDTRSALASSSGWASSA